MEAVKEEKLNRLYNMSELERAIIKMVWSDVKDLPIYDCFKKYERGFKFEGKDYVYTCRYRIESEVLKLIDTHIEHKQVTIDLLH